MTQVTPPQTTPPQPAITSPLKRPLKRPLNRLTAAMHRLVAGLGAVVLDFIAATGTITLFFVRTLVNGLRRPFYLRLLGRQLREIGYNSLPVVGLTALFTGMVLALQSYTGFSRFNAESAIASVVVLSMVRELGPVLAGLMVAGRVGAAMAAELGTMRVTEQIDALQTLSTNPYRYLIVPRMLAGILALPPLVLVADVIGVMGGWLVAVFKLGFNSGAYIRSTVEFVKFDDVASGLVKAAFFGFLITGMGCYHGFNSGRGAQGVGAATTRAVVSASILILVFDYLLTEAFFSK